MKTQLLCTFTTQQDLDYTISEIKKSYDIIFDRIYILQNENNIDELICTYNVNNENGVDYNAVKGTISLHRKKYSNTLYTINALNDLIRELNGGKLDKSFPINWDNYRNCLLLTSETGVNKINTKIHKIVKVSEWEG